MSEKEESTFVSSVTPTVKDFSAKKNADIFIIVGSDPMCDVQYSDPSISAQHLRVSMHKRGVLILKDLDSAVGTFFEGKKIEKQIVTTYDTIQIGHKPVQIRELAFYLSQKIRKKAVSKGTLVINNKTLTAGRFPPADIIIKNPLVSRKHFQIKMGSDSLLIKDVGSSNGTC